MNKRIENQLKSLHQRRLWALTISPKQRVGDPKLYYVDDRVSMVRLLSRFSEHYIMYPEFTLTGRLHYHGIVLITDNYKYYHTKHHLDKLGFTMWKPLSSFFDHLTWLHYCKKDWGYCKMKPIIYCDNSKFKSIQHYSSITSEELEDLKKEKEYIRKRNLYYKKEYKQKQLDEAVEERNSIDAKYIIHQCIDTAGIIDICSI